MSSILDEFKSKYPNSEEMGKANNIAEAVAAMPEGGGGGAGDSDLFVLHCDGTSGSGTIAETPEEFRAAFAAHKPMALDHREWNGVVRRYELVDVRSIQTDAPGNPGTPVEDLKFIFQVFIASDFNTSVMPMKSKNFNAWVINITCPLEGPLVLDGVYYYNIFYSES